MMRPKLIAIASAIGTFLLFSCKNEVVDLNRSGRFGLGDTIVLQKGDSTFIKDENITIVFNKVVSDSRCPIGVECFWAGEAIGEVKFTKGTATIKFNMSTNGGYMAVGTYLIKLADILPYPDLTKDIPRNYSAKIVLKKPQHQLLKGIVKDYTGLDGCGFIIELDNGTKLEPINASFFHFKDNLRIVLAYTPLTGITTTCMAGQTAQIDEIYELVE